MYKVRIQANLYPFEILLNDNLLLKDILFFFINLYLLAFYFDIFKNSFIICFSLNYHFEYPMSHSQPHKMILDEYKYSIQEKIHPQKLYFSILKHYRQYFCSLKYAHKYGMSPFFYYTQISPQPKILITIVKQFSSEQPPFIDIVYKLQLYYLMQSRRGWQQVEDDRLKKIIKKYGTKNWTLISEKLTINTIYERTGKQCRQRWFNHLNPSITKKQWSKKQDQILFEAHRNHSSKWKQISKLFPGRTDNSIKNHFYSTVRKCLRRIGKLQGQIKPIITMKSIKPFVLSKIVENTQLTQLIVQIGQDKYNKNHQETESYNYDGKVLTHIIQQLERINKEYEQKIKSPAQSSNPSPQKVNLLALQQLEDDDQDNIQSVQQKQEPEERQLKICPSAQSLKIYLSESNHHDSSDRYFIMETQSSRNRNQNGLIQMGQLGFFMKQKHPTAQKSQNDNKQWQDQVWIEQQSDNFFGSPLNKKHYLPDLRLLAKISQNSQSPGNIRGGQQRAPIIVPKDFTLKEQKMKIEFNPHDFFHKEEQN